MEKRVKTLLFLVLFICLSPALLSGSEPAVTRTYTFGVVPQFEQRKLYAIWEPIIRELEKRTGLQFKLVTTLKIQDFEKEFMKGNFDFAYMNPYFICKTASAPGYIPLVRDKAPLRGILLVRKDSMIKNISDLNGKTVAFPSPNAIGATLLIRADLERLYHVSVVPLYVKTHSSVYLHVVKEMVAAGGGVEKSFNEQEPAVKDSLRILYTTRQMPSHPVAALPTVPNDHRAKVRRALLEMGASAEGRGLLARIPVREFIPASIDDYMIMRDWGLDTYWDPFWSEE